MSQNVYLAGLISTDHPQSLQWRKDARRLIYDKSPRLVHIISPMDGKDQLAQFTRDGGVTDPMLTSKDVVMRDYLDVERSHVILANLNTYGATRPSIGTYSELAWAWILTKPVVAFVDSGAYVIRNHPFLREFVTRYEETLEDAVNFMLRYYLRRPIYPDEGARP